MGANKHQQMSKDKNKLENESDQEEPVNAFTKQDMELDEDWENPTSTQGELGGETPDLYEVEEEEIVSSTSVLSDDEDDAFDSIDEEGGKI